MLINTQALVLFLVCINLCWSAKHAIPFTSDEMVYESLDDLDLFKPAEHRASTTTPEKPSPTITPIVSKPDPTEIRQTSDVPNYTDKPLAIVSTGNTLNRIEQLVDNGYGSEHYELLEIVGSGSEGRVYRARPLSGRAKEMVDVLSKSHLPENVSGKQTAKAAYSSQWVAVKVLKIRSEKRHWIVRELKIMKQLGQHPHLVRFISAHLQRKDNTIWIAMGWIEGKNLGHIVDERADEAREKRRGSPAFDEDQTRGLAVSLFSALATLHALGSTHGDIDVSNVMMSQGVPVLIDVGDGSFEAERMGMDILMLAYALVECSVKPVMDVSYDGPIPLKHYDDDRRRAIRKVLEMVARGKFVVPEGVRTFVRDIVKGVKDKTTANDPLIQRHPFLNRSGDGGAME